VNGASFFTDITTPPRSSDTAAGLAGVVFVHRVDDDVLQMTTTAALLAAAAAGLLLMLLPVARRPGLEASGFAGCSCWVLSPAVVFSTTSLDVDHVLSLTNDTRGLPSFSTDGDGFPSGVGIFPSMLVVFPVVTGGLTEPLLPSGLLLARMLLIGCCCFVSMATMVACCFGAAGAISRFTVVETTVAGRFRGRPRPLDDTTRGTSAGDDWELKLDFSINNPQ